MCVWTCAQLYSVFLFLSVSYVCISWPFCSWLWVCVLLGGRTAPWIPPPSSITSQPWKQLLHFSPRVRNNKVPRSVCSLSVVLGNLLLWAADCPPPAPHHPNTKPRKNIYLTHQPLMAATPPGWNALLIWRLHTLLCLHSEFVLIMFTAAPNFKTSCYAEDLKFLLGLFLFPLFLFTCQGVSSDDWPLCTCRWFTNVWFTLEPLTNDC